MKTESSLNNQGSDVSPLKQKLTDDLTRALKSGDTVRRSVIRLVMAATQNAEIARRKKDESINWQSRLRPEGLTTWKLTSI